ncbi:hypothetical protein GAY28_04435 [Azospirillum brasilense]|nr:hypothetical protein [Azospirillum brasilense]
MSKKKGGKVDRIAGQLAFAGRELEAVAGRMERAGFGELASEVRALAGSAQFFLGEFEREQAEVKAQVSEPMPR